MAVGIGGKVAVAIAKPETQDDDKDDDDPGEANDDDESEGEGDDDEDEDEDEEGEDDEEDGDDESDGDGARPAKVAVGSRSPPKFVPRPTKPADYDGHTVVAQKHIGHAWANGPRIDLEHFKYVQQDFSRRQDAVEHLRERIASKSRPGYQLRVQRKWTCTTFCRMLARRHFAWMPCIIATMAEAVWDGDILQVHSMLIRHGDVNARDPHGQLVLNIAIQQQHEPIVRLLLDRGADFDLQDDVTLMTPLISSIVMGNKALTRRLLKRGADVNLADGDGLAPLAWATLRGYLELVAQLVELGADTTHQDVEGWTPLHIACFKGYTEVVEFLLVTAKVRLDIEDINGFSPYLFARIAENSDIVKKLDDFVADVASGLSKRYHKKTACKKKTKLKTKTQTRVDVTTVPPKNLVGTSKH